MTEEQKAIVRALLDPNTPAPLTTNEAALVACIQELATILSEVMS
jgi:hypothetical protein